MSAVAILLAVVSLLGLAVSAALLAVGLVRAQGAFALQADVPAGPARRRGLTRLGRLAAPLGRWISRLLPQRLSTRLSQRLARADLDECLSADAWFGLISWPWALAGMAALLALAADLALVASVALALAAAGNAVSETVLMRRIRDRERRFLKDLPAYLDVLTVCIEAGATLAVALRMAVDKAAPSPARKVFARLLHEIRMGRSRTEALHNVARLYELEALSSLVAALVQSEAHGMSLGAVLRAQSQQRATERQLRAEKAAMKAPVKMLGPLVLCIFPCTFVVIAVPVLVRMFLDGG